MISDVTRQSGKYLYGTREGVTEAGAALSRRLPAGSLILSNSGTVCVPKILKVDGCIHDGFIAFPTLDKFVDLNFAYWWFECVRPTIVDENRQGVTQVNLNTGIVREIHFPLAPIDEQRHIVAEIEKQFTRLDAGVASLKRVQAALKRYSASVLKSACEGRLLAGSHVPIPISATAPYGSPAAVPPGWQWTTPIEVCARVVDCHNKTANYSDSGIVLIRTSNVRSGKIDLSRTPFVDSATYEFWSRRCKPEPGDIIFTREAPMGEVGIIPPSAKICMGQRMMLMRASDRILNSFLSFALQSPNLKAHIGRTAVGSGVQHLRVRDVERLAIPLPPLAEQIRIVAEVERRLSVVEELEAAVGANLKRAERLRQSILNQAFIGKLVPAR
jgi:type I restriction enzyme, S subunit